MHKKKVMAEVSKQKARSNSGVDNSSGAVTSSLSPISRDDIWPDDGLRDYPAGPALVEARKELEDWRIKHPLITFGGLMTTEFPKARYVLEPFFEAGTVNMVSAPPNTWKSWLLFAMSSSIAEGQMFLNKFPTEKCNLLIVNEEDSCRAIQDRFRLLGITNNDLNIWFRVAQGSKLEENYVKVIIEECKERMIGCVMFDSLRSMHEGNENDSTEMQIVLDKLKAISREGITVIFTHHHRKKSMFSKGDDAEASRGSSAINAAISGHISLEEETRDSGTYLILRHLKSKAGEKLEPVEIKIIKEMGKVEFNYEGEFKSGEGKLRSAKDAIMFSMKPGDFKTVNDFYLLEIAGKNVVRVAMNTLVEEGVLISMIRKEARDRGLVPLTGGNPKEKLYSLPSDEEEAVQDSFDEL